MIALHQFSGIVVKNKERGKNLGFPTANISVPKEVPDGIYAGLTIVDGKEFPSAIFVGKAEHYHETERFAETHILDFSDDLYGKEIELRLTKKLRESTTFESEEKLVEQIGKDIAMVRELFAIGSTAPSTFPARGGEAEERGGRPKSSPPREEGYT